MPGSGRHMAASPRKGEVCLAQPPTSRQTPNEDEEDNCDCPDEYLDESDEQEVEEEID